MPAWKLLLELLGRANQTEVMAEQQPGKRRFSVSNSGRFKPKIIHKRQMTKDTFTPLNEDKNHTNK